MSNSVYKKHYTISVKFDFENYDARLDNYLSVTKNFFTRGEEPLMKQIHLSDCQDGEYLIIRNDEWPEGVEFRWLSPDFMVFCFKSGSIRVPKGVDQTLNDLGFEYSDNSMAYRKTIIVPKGKDIGDGTFFGLSDKLQEAFLEDVYRNYAEPIIKSIIPGI